MEAADHNGVLLHRPTRSCQLIWFGSELIGTDDACRWRGCVRCVPNTVICKSMRHVCSSVVSIVQHDRCFWPAKLTDALVSRCVLHRVCSCDVQLPLGRRTGLMPVFGSADVGGSATCPPVFPPGLCHISFPGRNLSIPSYLASYWAVFLCSRNVFIGFWDTNVREA